MANNLMQELMIEQLRDLYDAEKQLTKALPKLAKAAEDEELANAFREHQQQTQGQAQRLEQIFESLGMRAKGKPCEAMKGLVNEGQEMISRGFEAPVGDLGLVAAARRVEHYEMAAYETLAVAAQASKQTQVAQLLQETLKEEAATDKLLATIGKRLAKEAVQAQSAQQDEGAAARSSRKGSKSASNGAGGGSKKKASSKPSGAQGGKQTGGQQHSSGATTDHDEIRNWAEQRGGKPACVTGTGGKGDTGLLRIEFPGKPNAKDDKLTEISWDEFFEKFDESGLALVYQEETASGEVSNFNKLVSRASTKQKTSAAH